jgi:hypothetical protein
VPIVHCHTFYNVLTSFAIVSLSSNAALFFFQVKAVYHNKFVTAFFGFLWFGFSCLNFILLVASKAGHLATTKRCITTKNNDFALASGFYKVGYDTLVFLAISIRIVSYSIEGETFSGRVRSFLRGDGLPHLSRSLLKGGQLYYSFVVML